MPSKEETKELAKDTSKRGQPIPSEILAEAEKSIAGDTSENNSGQQKETDANSP